MRLNRRTSRSGARWSINDDALPRGFTLGQLLEQRRDDMMRILGDLVPRKGTGGEFLAPVEAHHEVWAAGVTYLRSRVEREAESTVADVYANVYVAERPEIFFKATGVRVVGPNAPIRIRRDSAWNVPEPELTLVINRYGEIVGYTAGNDVSSRSIEGENPLYLPQAKCYDGACAIGSEIILASADELSDIPIRLSIIRSGELAFAGEANTNQMKRNFQELAEFLYREMTFPQGAFLMTGTGIVPTQEFTLVPGDLVRVTVGEVTLENEVAANL